MGSPDSEPDRYVCEGPAHTVIISKDFYIGKYEVTQAQWQLIMGNNPSKFQNGDNYPVEQVSWDDICQAGGFLEKTNQLKPSGYSGFRLPTEAEWEYAARAGTQTRFYWGNDPSYTLIGDNAWYINNSSSTTHPVGQKMRNAFGLYDMSGNVWEWCNDWYGPYGGDVTDPIGPATGYSRVFRGGSWYDNCNYACRSAFRSHISPSHRSHPLGFRLALSPGQK